MYYLNLLEMKDKLYDAVINEPAKFQPEEFDVNLSEGKPSEWRLKFLPTLCPNCAWDLEGDRDSVVLICRNCSTAWQPDQDKFTRVNGPRFADPVNVEIDNASRGPSTEGAALDDDELRDGVITNYAISQMEKLRTKNQPFFLAVGYRRPHAPFVAPEQYFWLHNRWK